MKLTGTTGQFKVDLPQAKHKNLTHTSDECYLRLPAITIVLIDSNPVEKKESRRVPSSTRKYDSSHLIRNVNSLFYGNYLLTLRTITPII